MNKITTYFRESYKELLEKVTWPTWLQLQSSTVIVLVGCYYGYNASGGPVGVGTATAKSMVLNIVLVHLLGMIGTQLFWGANPRAPIGG